MFTLGKKLKELAQKSPLSNNKIADKLGVSVNTLYNFYDREHLDTEILIKSCSIFNVELVYFFGELEGIKLSEKEEEKEELAKENIWSKKYLEAQEKVNKLQDEISDLKSKFIFAQSDFIETQKETLQKMTMILGKRKVYSKSKFETNKVQMPKKLVTNLNTSILAEC